MAPREEEILFQWTFPSNRLPNKQRSMLRFAETLTQPPPPPKENMKIKTKT